MTAVDADPHARFAARREAGPVHEFPLGPPDHTRLLPTAVDEILRYESPVKMSTIRVTTEPLTIGETTIPASPTCPSDWRDPDDVDAWR